MLRSLRRLFQHYEDYHAYGPSRLRTMGYVGAITYVAFFFLRFTRPNVDLWDDLPFRAPAVVLFAFMGLRDYWPERLKRYYVPYTYGVLLYCLPCFTVLLALERGGGVANISNAFIILCFLVLLTDWRNTLVMLMTGTLLATLFYVMTAPHPRVPMDLVVQLPAFALVVIGGTLFKSNTDKIDAERKLRATQALAGSIAHEMRHPLVQLKHSLEGMQGVLPPPGSVRDQAKLNPQQVQSLYRLLARGEQAVQRGLQVISMTLDEVSARPIDASLFRYLSAAEAVQQAVDEYSYDTDEFRDRVDVHVQEDFTFRGDETAFLFVLFNLIKNALYYVPAYPQTRVTITVGNQEVCVRDSGPGIPADVLAGLFEAFRSVGKSGGTGLGLSYCQRVMRAFGGEIRCASEVGRFTAFTLRFPAISAEEQERHRIEALAQARTVLAGKRILVVEDDEVQLVATRQKLAPLAHTTELDEAADGEKALELLAARKYDLVLLDLQMPRLDGYAVAERIRLGSELNRDTRIVAYTSEPVHLARARALKSGMDHFVAKPCAQLALLGALQHAVQQPGAASSGVASRLAGRRILIADDSAFNRKAIAAYLRNAAAIVIEVEHGAAVLEQLRAQEGIHAVIVDLHMPGMDGLETARAIRGARESWSGLPILAMTARSDEPAVAAATAAGMNGFLVKPVDAMLLYETLSRLMSGGSAVGATTSSAGGRDAQEAQASHQGMLNLQRLESYRRLGMLDELLNDYLPEMQRLVRDLQQTVDGGDVQGSIDALHSLLGMSGEAGAQALYQNVRRLYVPLLEEGQWPSGHEWLPQLQALAARTEEALKAYCAQQAASGAAP